MMAKSSCLIDKLNLSVIKFVQTIKSHASFYCSAKLGPLLNNVGTLIEFIEFYLYTWPIASITSTVGERKSEEIKFFSNQILLLLLLLTSDLICNLSVS